LQQRAGECPEWRIVERVNQLHRRVPGQLERPALRRCSAQARLVKIRATEYRIEIPYTTEPGNEANPHFSSAFCYGAR
jgi:hypothetical protein